jgi:predicted Zn-dependent protease
MVCFACQSPSSKITFESSLITGIKGKRTDIKYNLGCLRDSSVTDKVLGFGSDLEGDIIEKTTGNITLAEEITAGDTIYEHILKTNKFIYSGDEYDRIGKIINKLIPLIDSPRGFKYKYYLIDANEVNAFTAGGKIFVYKGILNQITNDDELACVLGHEIYHNELGHINRKIRKNIALKRLLQKKRAKYVGYAMIIFGAAFNQDEETLCDLHGVDLAQQAGYKGCSAIDFWKRVSKQENPTNFSKLLRSHPYGKQRMNCIRHHIEENYHITCTN